MGKLFFLIIIIEVFLFSCVKEDIENDETLYTGHTSSGEIDSCQKIKPGIACSLLFDEVEDQFRNDCENSGFTTIQCDCQKFICLGNITREGFDISGKLRTCKGIAEDGICTAVVLEGDEFAYRCNEEGYTPYKCGCHDYICVGGMPNQNQVLEGIGLDINGKFRTCNAMADDIMCTAEVTEGDEFAYRCNEDGNTPFQCGCHDYICIPTFK